MRRLVIASAILGALSVEASAQMMVFITPGDPLKSCLTQGWVPRPNDIEASSWRSEKGIAAYLKLASAGADVSKWFVGSKKIQHWALDGVPVATRVARDPWAARISRLERTAIITGGNRSQYRAIWKAFDSDGVELGTYDAWLQTGDGGARLLGLDLYSPNSVATPKPLTPFCIKPGDIEEWKVEQAKLEAERAAKSSRQGTKPQR